MRHRLEDEMENPVEIQRRKGTRLLSSDGRTAAPRRFKARIHFVGGKLRKLPAKGKWPRDRYIGRGAITGDGGLLVTLDIELGYDAMPICRAMNLEPEPPSTEPLTAISARVPLLRLMKLALTEATVEIGEPDAEGNHWAIHGGREAMDAFVKEHAGGARPPRRGLPLTDEDLARTARLYMEAKKHARRRHAPRKAVADAEGVSLATAARRIRMARDAGYLTV